jgi:hypothetical protein
MDKETLLKIKISEAATGRYLNNPRFTIQSLGESLDMSAKDIFDLFPNRRSILDYYYESRMILYKESVENLEDYSEFTLSERLNHLFLTLLDSFEEHREFILNTYKEKVVWDKRRNAFRKSFKEELKTIFSNDPRITRSSTIFQNELLWKSVLLQFHGLIAFWTNDSSRMRENSMALADKWSSLVEEVFYTRIIDKGFDIGKFLWMNSSLNKCISDENFCFPSFCRSDQTSEEKKA